MFGLDGLSRAPLAGPRSVPMCTIELGGLIDLSPPSTISSPNPLAFRTCKVDQLEKVKHLHLLVLCNQIHICFQHLALP